MVDQRDWPTAISFSNGDVMKFKCFSGFERTVYKMRSNSLPFLDFCFCPFNFLPTRNARNFFHLIIHCMNKNKIIFVLRQLKNTRKSVTVEWEMSDAQLLQSCRVLSTTTAFLALYSRETLMIASVSRWLNCRRSKLSEGDCINSGNRQFQSSSEHRLFQRMYAKFIVNISSGFSYTFPSILLHSSWQWLVCIY